MRLHPSVILLSKRLWLFLPVAGAVALAANGLSLSKGSFPGYSAALIAEAAGLVPPSGVAHPVFLFLARQIAALDPFSLTVRLNLFSVLCGSLCTMLLYYLVARRILFSACEDGGGGAPNELMDDKVAFLALQPEVDAYNRRMFKIAAGGGLIAAFLVTFMVPTWSASTRLDNGPFDLLLALAALALYPRSGSYAKLARLTASTFLFVIGVFDSAVFLLILPYFAFLVFSDFVQSGRRSVLVGMTVFAGVSAAVLSIAAYGWNTGAWSAIAARDIPVLFARGLVRHHWGELQSFFPRMGWLLAVIQVGVPALVLLFGQQLLFKEKRPNTLMALFLVTLSALPTLLSLSVAPFFLFQPIGHLPVFGTALLAAAVASVVASCLVFIGPDDQAVCADLSVIKDYNAQRRLSFRKGVVGGLLPIALVVVAATPLRSFRAVSARQGDFADRVAREMLAEMKDRTCLVTNGMLDNHLRVQARVLSRPLTLITVRSRPQPQEYEDIRRFIASSPVFEGLNRQRLLNALSIGPARFVMEWFNSDAKAGRHAMVFATPDLWVACGYRAIPEGMAFGGIRAADRPDLVRLAEQNRAFAERVAPLLSRQYPEYGQVASLRALLRMKAGFAANELGVLLEELGDLEGAYSAYLRAGALDPVNVSAAVNSYALTLLRGVHPESGDVLKKRMKHAVENARVSGPQDMAWVLQNHGAIHQQAFYRQQQVMWSSLGVGTAAVAKTRKVQSLAERTGTDALVENAAIYKQTGDLANAEKCYLAVLEKDALSRDALIGMCTLMISQGKVRDAEAWRQKALDAAVEPLALRYQTVSIAVLKNETERALKLLESATKEVPSDLRYWTLLADLLLKRGDTQLVERQLLPDMQKALNTSDHYLVHAIRGMALRSKGPGSYKEARQSLLRALSMNASLPDIWSALLQLDLDIGNSAFIESDVRRQLVIDPDHALANYLMGALLLSRGALQESEDFLRRSVERRPTAAACNDLAENLRLQKKLPEAEASARQALALEPELVPALDTLACVLYDAGRFEESARFAGRAVTAIPDHAAYQITLLRAQVRLGDKEGVRQRMEKLTATQSTLPDALRKEVEALR